MRRGKPSSTRDRLMRGAIGAILLAVAVVVLVPILNLVALSFSDSRRVSEVTGLTIIPRGFSLVNYRVLAGNPLFMKSILNSVFITVVGTAINLVITSMAAFALTRSVLPLRRFFMLLVIVVMVLEPGLIPEYLVVKRIGLMNSLWAVILYKTVNVYYLIILMRFFEEVPPSLIEAARVDGAGWWTILWRVLIRANIYLSDPEKYPLQLILRQFVVLDDTTTLIGSGAMLSYDEAAQMSYGALKASTIVVAMLPVLVVYPLILKYYTKGVMEGGVKE
jgi:putative aldouronate transport system permease protein